MFRARGDRVNEIHDANENVARLEQSEICWRNNLVGRASHRLLRGFLARQIPNAFLVQ
jgi:hypothetical protein